ncbi:MAG: hypothetical protein ABIO94_05295, partial [Opitutaceae bacterium]
MKNPLSLFSRGLVAFFSFIAVVVSPALCAAATAPTVAKSSVNQPVTVSNDGKMFTLDNGIIQVRINL